MSELDQIMQARLKMREASAALFEAETLLRSAGAEEPLLALVYVRPWLQSARRLSYHAYHERKVRADG